MATYVILNIIFLIVVTLSLVISKMFFWDRVATATLLIVLLFTAIFDSLIINYGIVQYNEALTLGIAIGKAPVEDFFYAILAVLIVVSTWNYFDRKALSRDGYHKTTI